MLLTVLLVVVGCGDSALRAKVRKSLNEDLGRADAEGLPAKFTAELTDGLTAIMFEVFTEAEIEAYVSDPRAWEKRMAGSEKHAEYLKKCGALQKTLIGRVVADALARRAREEAGTPQAVHAAIRDGRSEEAKRLIESGSDLGAVDKVGMTPLDWAASVGNVEIAELLIAKGANVNSVNPVYGGYSPLHSAAFAGQRDVAELLIRHGADVNAADKDGNTPLAIAEKKNHADCVALLRRHNSDE